MHVDDIASAADSTEDAYLFRKVLQQSDLWLEVTKLSSQTRGEVSRVFVLVLYIPHKNANASESEQLSIHRGPALVEDYGVVGRAGPTAWQYRLEETGPTFAVKGLGRFL